MLIEDLTIPSWRGGFARDASESAHPELWNGLVGAWVPALGPTGNILFDVTRFKNHGTLTDMDPATDWVPSGDPRVRGYALDFYNPDTNSVLVSNFDAPSRGTILVRIKFTALPGLNNRFVGDVFNFDLHVQNNGYYWVYLFTTVAPSTSVTINTGQWYTLGATWVAGGGDVTAIVNGLPDGSIATDTDPGTFTLSFGRSQGTGYITGDISIACIYDYVLPSGLLKTWHNDPLALFRLRRQRVWAIAPGGAIISLIGTSPGVSTVTGIVDLQPPLSGTAVGASGASGILGVTLKLVGSVPGVSTVSGLLGRIRPLVGSIPGASTVSGVIGVLRGLVGSSGGSSSVSGTVGVTRGLQGTAPGTSTTSGSLSVLYKLVGSIPGVSTAVGTLTGFATTVFGSLILRRRRRK